MNELRLAMGDKVDRKEVVTKILPELTKKIERADLNLVMNDLKGEIETLVGQELSEIRDKLSRKASRKEQNLIKQAGAKKADLETVS
jgi:hypothetical protein